MSVVVFQASLTNPITSQPDISVSSGVITDSDDSNYALSTEQGHSQSDFSQFRKIKFINPDSTSWLLSTLGDGQATTIVAAGAALPVIDNYTYSTGDGVYTCILYTLPTWNSYAAYVIVTNPYVFYNGVVYQALGNSTGVIPGFHPRVWAVVTNIDNLPTKYRVSITFAITCDIQTCYAMKTKAQNCDSGDCNWNNLPQSKNFLDATKLCLILDAIQPLVNAGAWTQVTDLINLGRSICCCNQ